MFLLINTFNSIPGHCVGTVISRHRSLEAAQAADKSLQRAIKRRYPGSYVPTEIVEVTYLPGSAWVTHEYLAGARVDPELIGRRNAGPG